MLEFLTAASPLSAIACFVFLGLFSAATCAVCASLIARTMPARVTSAVTEMAERLADQETVIRRLQTDWQTTIEGLESLEDSIEKKRRQTAASASRAQRAQQDMAAQEQQPASPADQLIALRQKIYGQAGSWGKL